MPPKTPASRKPKPSAKRSPLGPKPWLYTLEVCLTDGPVTDEFCDANPVVSRTIQIRGNQTLEDLHDAIFNAFGRFDAHMYEFQFGKRPMERDVPRYVMDIAIEDQDSFEDFDYAGSTSQTTIDSLELAVKQKFHYWFDFGDDWWHRITVKRIEDLPAEGDFPRVIESVGEDPPQYPVIE